MKNTTAKSRALETSVQKTNRLQHKKIKETINRSNETPEIRKRKLKQRRQRHKDKKRKIIHHRRGKTKNSKGFANWENFEESTVEMYVYRYKIRANIVYTKQPVMIVVLEPRVTTVAHSNGKANFH